MFGITLIIYWWLLLVGIVFNGCLAVYLLIKARQIKRNVELLKQAQWIFKRN